MPGPDVDRRDEQRIVEHGTSDSHGPFLVPDRGRVARASLVAIPCGVARSRDEGKAKDWGASETHDWGVAPPHAPGWIGTDVDELRDVEPPVVGESAAKGDENDEAFVASHVEVAMQNLQHHHVRPEPDEEEDPLYCFGSGDATVYAIKDGPKRFVIGRAVGRDGEGCVYCLVGTSSSTLLARLDRAEVAASEAFDGAADLTLCSVFLADHAPRRHFQLAALNEPVSNVVLVQRYKRIEDVPVEYRPGQRFLGFTDE